MSNVREFLRRRRKAELQTIHQFWYPGESRLSTRDDLEKRVAQALSGGLQLDERLARLSKPQKSLLSSLVRKKPEYAVEVRSAQKDLERTGISKVEIESTGRMLVERGFIDRQRLPTSGGDREVYQIPAELGLRLEELLESESDTLAPADQLTQRRLQFEVDFEGQGLEDRIRQLSSPKLQQLVRLAVERRGLLEFRADAARSIMGDDEPPSDWSVDLEKAGIGTLGSISLSDFGITLQAPTLIVLQEWIRQEGRAALGRSEEPDTVVEAGVDLYIDLERVAMKLSDEPGKLTREGKVPKRLQDRIRDELYLSRIDSEVEGDMAELLLGLTQRLAVVERYGGELRVDEDRLRLWRKLDLVRQAEIVLDRFSKERRGARWSFHQEALREILLDSLRELGPKSWVSFDALIAMTVSTYLLELEEREVRESLRELREEEFSQERLTSSFSRLGSDLVYWVVHRLLLVGLCEIGYVDGRLASFRLTALGKKILDVPEEPGDSRVLVNPDFEIILFCEGLTGQKLELALARFGQRVSAERIRRYRVSRESVRFGIRSGLSSKEMHSLLEEASDYPLPESITFDLRDWAKDLDWIGAQAAVWLSGVRTERAEEICDFLGEQGYLCHICGSDGLAVVSSDRERSIDLVPILELLRDRGWLVRPSSLVRPALDLETDER